MLHEEQQMAGAIVFLFGFMFGCMVSFLWIVFLVSKAKKKAKKITEDVKQVAKKLESTKDSVKKKMAMASKIAEQQLMLQEGAMVPSKNALRSKHKNGIIGEIKRLEEEKLALLHSIINDDKVDPVITVMDEASVKHEMKLSEFLHQKASQSAPPPPKLQPKVKIVGKFVIHKGGKDDGGVVN